EQGVTTRQVVVGQRIGRTELHEPLVDLQPFGIAALESQVRPLGAKDIDIAGMVFEDAAEEIELEIELALLGQAGEGATGRRGRLGTFVGLLARFRHGVPLQVMQTDGLRGPLSKRLLDYNCSPGKCKPKQAPRTFLSAHDESLPSVLTRVAMATSGR